MSKRDHFFGYQDDIDDLYYYANQQYHDLCGNGINGEEDYSNEEDYSGEEDTVSFTSFHYSKNDELMKRYYNKELEKDDIWFLLDLDVFIIDAYCKMELFRLCKETKYKGKADCSPGLLRDTHYIKTNQYADWKMYIPNTKIAEDLEYNDSDDSDEIIKYFDDLLKYVEPAILLLYDLLVEDNLDIDFNSKFWDEVEGLLDKYSKNHEKWMPTDYFCKMIKSQYEIYDDNRNIIFSEEKKDKYRNYLLDDEDDNIYTNKMDTNRERHQSVKDKLMDIGKNLAKNSVLGNKSDNHGKGKANKTVKRKRLSLPAFYAPILATICEYKKENPFLSVNKYKESNDKLYCFHINDTGEKEKIDRYYTRVKHYFKYKNGVDSLAAEFSYSKYSIFCNLMIYNIMSDKNPVKESNRIYQYYAMEQFLGLQFVTNATELIIEDLNNRKVSHDVVDQKYLFHNYRELRSLLRRIYEHSGIIIRIKFLELLKELISVKVGLEEKVQDRKMLKSTSINEYMYLFIERCNIYNYKYITDDTKRNKDKYGNSIDACFSEYKEREQLLCKKEEEKKEDSRSVNMLAHIKRIEENRERDRLFQTVAAYVVRFTVLRY